MPRSCSSKPLFALLLPRVRRSGAGPAAKHVGKGLSLDGFLLHVIDDSDFKGLGSLLDLQAELLLESFEDTHTAWIRRGAACAGRVRRPSFQRLPGRPGKCEVPAAFNP